MTKYPPFNLVIHGNPKYRRDKFPFEPNTGPQAAAYEERVRVTLNAIGRQEIGTALFASLSSLVPVYIVPYTAGGCNAVTGQLTSILSMGVRIQYSPDTWAYDACGRIPGYRPVETLFHEMVHASRFTNLGFAGLDKNPLPDMQDAEEFLAVMLTNVFRSEVGARTLNRDYRTGALVSQIQLEMYLASRSDLMRTLGSLLSDVLVKSVVRLKAPFNPFRDLNRLKAIQNQQVVPGPTRIA